MENTARITGNRSIPRMAVAVIGHSFVQGLLDHLQNKKTNTIQPRNIAVSLKVNHSVKGVQLVGKRGALVKDLPELFERSNINPDIVILSIGVNDITNGENPNTLADTVCEFAEELVTKDGGYISVAVLSITPRAETKEFSEVEMMTKVK